MPRARRLLMVGMVTTALVAAACTRASDGTGFQLGKPVPGTPVPHPIEFRDCTEQLLAAGAPVPKPLQGTVRFGCAQFTVPLDYRHPAGRTVTLAVVRIHTTQNTSRPVQSLLVNPGGPGGSGLNFGLGLFAQLPVSVTRKYDLIAFDPRGVGQSSPVRCLTDSQKDAYTSASPDLTTRAGAAQAEQLSRGYSRRCAQALGSRLPYFNTVNTARDMDQLRQAVGDDVMNYLGFSYGTELGWTYAHLFPREVRRFVLDGAVDPARRNSQSPLLQVKGFESAFDQFAAWCRTAPDCRSLGDARAAAERIFSRARQAPLETNTARRLTESYASTGVIEALYSRSEWPRLASAMAAALHGDGSALLALADQYNQRSSTGSYTNLIDANSVISCNDSPYRPPPSPAHVAATARAWAKQYPLFGGDSASALFGCTGWQRQRTPVPAPAAATPKTVLVVGNLHDPATPYVGARHLTADLGHARLLTWNGEGHTSYLNGSKCIDSYVTGYLVTGTVPPPHKLCPAG